MRGLVMAALVIACAALPAGAVSDESGAPPSASETETPVEAPATGTAPETETRLGAPAVPPAPDAATIVEAPKPFEEWLEEFIGEARGRGYSEALLTETLAGLQPLVRVVEKDRTQAERILTVDEYVRRRVTPAVVRRGRTLARQHQRLLARVARTYRVPSAFIVAIWGLESQYGTSSGRTPVFQALATLAWEARRGAFFRAQLHDALTMVERGDIETSRMMGSWAGAMGQPQFMPSSYLAWAVDFDGDGRRDIWTSYADIFASIANYLHAHGWRPGERWGREVRVTDDTARRIATRIGPRSSGCLAMRNMTESATLAGWRQIGVRRADGGRLPSLTRRARIVQAGERHFLVYDNYDALLRYNCAHAYALSVALLAERLR
jgi:membrane-bound lytic murein transglycosylase B